MTLLKVLAISLVFGLVRASGQSRATAKDNGYEDVVVGISPMLKEKQADDLIKAIKTSLTEASHTLYIATQGKLYFKDVKILIPKAWSNTSFHQPAQTERFEDSDWRVDKTNPVYGHQPYTVQPGGCGEPGRYIHLTTDFLLDDETAKWWGPRGKVLIKQWAQLRWGVFDEIGYNNDPRYPLYYWEEEEVVNGNLKQSLRPNTCTEKPPSGKWMDINSKKECSFEGQVPGKHCRFVPDLDQNVTSSLMAYQYLSSVEEFCKGEAVHKHNVFAPNRHNLLCKRQSVWEVIMKHPDFKIPQENANVNSTPSFTVVREVDASFALVLDYSGSMSSSDRITRLQKSAQRWILHEVAEGSAVGIVGFSGSAFLMAKLTVISGESSRRDLAKAIHTSLLGATCIGCGLQMAVSQVLNNAKNKVIILISDGEENANPRIDEVMDEVVNSGARVVTIAYGKSAEEKMEKLAQNTGGKSYIVFDEDDGTMADDAFDGALTYQPGNTLANATIQIYEYEYKGDRKYGNGSFVVDATLGRNLRFRLNAKSASHIKSPPFLVSPYGTIYDNSSVDSSVNMWIIQIDNAEDGTWSWEVGLSGNKNENMRVSVSAQAKDPETLPIYTESWMNVGSQNVNASQTLVIIYARVTQGNKPVVGAKVRAYVTRPDNTDAPVEIDLLDNGQAADTQSGDGVYSRYFTLYSSLGRYAVKAQVWDEGNSYINNGFIASRRQQRMASLPFWSLGGRVPPSIARMATADPLDGPEPCCGSIVPFDESTAIPTGQFTRTAVAGSFLVTFVPASGDYFAPSRVLDLEVSSEDGLMLHLTWTAPGDDLDAGNVSGYEIRMSTNLTELMEDSFDDGGNGILLVDFSTSENMTDLLLEGGQTVSTSLELTEELEVNQLYYFALRAIDDDNKKSEVSNHATLFIINESNKASYRLVGWEIGLIALGLCLF